MALNTLTLFKGTLLKAFFYISYADGKIDERELALGEAIIKNEKINKQDFDAFEKEYKNNSEQNVHSSLTKDLKKLSRDQQITILAYMSNVANSNGFMDPEEWKIIYNLYKNELQLGLEEILKRQKDLPPFK